MTEIQKDAITTIWHDLLGRQTKIQDTEGHADQMAYDGFGNKVKFTNKLGGVFTYTHDKLGRVLTETQPVTVRQYNAQGVLQVNPNQIPGKANTEWLVVTGFEYDSRGNVIKKVEAQGLNEQRVTVYSYDKLDRLKTTTGETTATYTVVGGSATQTPIETRTYDKRGNLIEVKAADGGRTLFYYDALNRKAAQLQAVQRTSGDNLLGVFTKIDRSQTDGSVTTTTHETLVALPLPATSWVPPTAPLMGARRKVVEYFDANARLIRSTTPDVMIGQVEPDNSYKVRTASLTTERFYDKNGNLIREKDARGNLTHHYYDRSGNLLITVDALRYVTLWERDAAGNITKETRYATPLSTLPGQDLSSASPSLIRSSAQTSSEDRVTEFDLDRLGRVKSQRLLSVEAFKTSSTGAVSADASVASTTFSYNGEGGVLTKKDALNGSIIQRYDEMGRQIRLDGVSYFDKDGQSVTPTTLTEYDAFGQVIRVTRKGVAAGDDRVEKFSYDVNGNQKSQTDALGVVTTFQVDVAGRITGKSFVRSVKAGVASTDFVEYEYDLMGRQTQQASKSQAVGSATALVEETRQTRYDAFGGITASGWNDGWQVFNEYDNAGRLIKTNQGGGVTKAYVRDANGNATLQIDSTGADIKDLTIGEILGLSAGELVLDKAAAGQLQSEGTALTVSVYDKRNQLIETRQPTLTGNAEKATVTQTISQAQSTAYAGGVVGVGGAFNGVVSSAPSTEGVPTKFVTIGDVTTTVTHDVRKQWNAQNGSNWLGFGDGNPHYERAFAFRVSSLPPQLDVFRIRVTNNSFGIDLTYNRTGGPVRLNNLAHGLQTTDISYDWSTNSINVSMYGHLSGDNSWSTFYNAGNFGIGVDGQLTSPQDAVHLFYDITPFGVPATGRSITQKNGWLLLPPLPQGVSGVSVFVATELGDYKAVPLYYPPYSSGAFLEGGYAVRLKDIPQGALKFLVHYKIGGGSLQIAGSLINRDASPSVSVNATKGFAGENVDAKITTSNGIKSVELLITASRLVNESGDSLMFGGFYYRRKGASGSDAWVRGDFRLVDEYGASWADGVYDYKYSFSYRRPDGDHEWVNSEYHGSISVSGAGSSATLTQPVSVVNAASTVHFKHLPHNAETIELAFKRVGDVDWGYAAINVKGGAASFSLLDLYRLAGNEVIDVKYTIRRSRAQYEPWTTSNFLASGKAVIDLSNKSKYQAFTPDVAPTKLSILPPGTYIGDDSSDQQRFSGALSSSVMPNDAAINLPGSAAGWATNALTGTTQLGTSPIGTNDLIRTLRRADWAGGQPVSLSRSIEPLYPPGSPEIPPPSAFDLKPNTTYTISVWAKLERGLLPTGGSLLKSTYHDGSGMAVEALDFKDIVLDNTWRQYSITFTNHQALDYKGHLDELLVGLTGLPVGVSPWQAYPPSISLWGYQVIESPSSVASGNDLSSAAWVKTGASVSSSTVKSANSDSVVQKVAETAATSAHQVAQQISVASPGRYTYALDLKAGERTLAEVAIRRSDTTYSYYNSQAEDKSQISASGKGQLARTVTEQMEVNSQSNATSYTTLTNYRTYQWWDDAKVILQTAGNATVSIEAKKSKAGYGYSVSSPGGGEVMYANGFAVHTYDVNGHLMRVDDPANQTAGVTDKGRSIQYVTNAQGLILKRTELANGNANPSTGIVTGGTALKFRRFYYLDGKVVGDVSNNGKDQSQTSYAEQMAAIEQAEQNKGKDDRYKRWQPIASANFDQNYLPINPDYPSNASYNYTVRSNSETLQSIALSVWGDSAMWYLIAEANGLKADTALLAGQALTIPNKVTNIHNNTSTYRVYDAGAAIGDVSPTAPFPPPPPPPKKGCGGTGMVLMIVVAIVATVLTAGAAAVAMGAAGSAWGAGAAVLSGSLTGSLSAAGALTAAAVGGAAGSIASQVVGMATGDVEKFSWSAVAKSALTSAASAGAGQALNSLSQSSQAAQAANIQFKTVDGVLQAANAGTAVARAVAANVFTQGLSMALGMQRKFDWRGVAASAVGSAGGQAAGALTRNVDLRNAFANQVFGGTVQNMASGWGESAAYEYRPAWAQLAAGSFGSALGDAVVGSIVQSEREKQQRDQMYGLGSGDGKGGLKLGRSGGAGLQMTGSAAMTFSSDVDNSVAAGARQLAEQDELDRQKSANWTSASGKVWDADDRAYEAERPARIREQHRNADAYRRQLAREAAAQREYAAARARLDGYVGGGPVSAGSFAAGSVREPSNFGTPMPVKLGNGGNLVPNYEYSGSGAAQVPMAAPQQQVRPDIVGRVREGALSLSADLIVSGGRQGGLSGTALTFAGYGGLTLGTLMPSSAEDLFIGVATGGASLGVRGGARLVANSAESFATRRTYLNEKFGRTGDINTDINIRARQVMARDFYEEAGFSGRRLENHLKGIDYSNDVDLYTLPKGRSVAQWQPTEAPVGNYFSRIGGDPNRMGIDVDGRQLLTYAPGQNTTVLRSTAADIPSWKGDGRIYHGGEIQYFTKSPEVFQIYRGGF